MGLEFLQKDVKSSTAIVQWKQATFYLDCFSSIILNYY